MMVEKKRKVPNLRFEGFTNDWVQRNLGEVVQKVKSYSLSRDVETEDDTGFEYIHYGDIHTQKADVIDGNTKLPSIVPGDYDLVQVGDVIVADASEDYIGIAEPAVVVNKPTQNLVAGLHTIAIRPNGIHPLFLYYLLHTQLFKHFGYRTGTGLKVFSISYPNLAKFTFAMPTLDEQEAIANTLRDMDNLIAANQRKLDLLKEQKKGYLQKMFPKNGAKVPELRFAGFADDWEERKLGDAVSISSGVTGDATLQDGEYRLTRIESISQGMLNVARLGFTNEKPDQKYLLNLGDILYSNINSLSHIGKVALVDTAGIYHGINLLRFQMRNDVDSEFLFQRLNTMPMKSWAVSHANPAVSQASINQTELSKQPISSPTITEQQKIGSFFKQLDDTIDLQHQKLAKYQSVKKSLLQQMFI